MAAKHSPPIRLVLEDELQETIRARAKHRGSIHAKAPAKGRQPSAPIHLHPQDISIPNGNFGEPIAQFMQNRLQSAQGVVAFTESEVQPFLRLPGCLQLRAQGWDFGCCRLRAGAILRWNRIRRWGPQVPSPKQDNRWTAVSLCSAHPAWQSPSGPKHSAAGPGNRSSGHTNYQVLGSQRSDRRLECSCLPSSQVHLQSGQRAANLQGRSMPMQSMAPKEQVTDIPILDVWQSSPHNPFSEPRRPYSEVTAFQAMMESFGHRSGTGPWEGQPRWPIHCGCQPDILPSRPISMGYHKEGHTAIVSELGMGCQSHSPRCQGQGLQWIDVVGARNVTARPFGVSTATRGCHHPPGTSTFTWSAASSAGPSLPRRDQGTAAGGNIWSVGRICQAADSQVRSFHRPEDCKASWVLRPEWITKMKIDEVMTASVDPGFKHWSNRWHSFNRGQSSWTTRWSFCINRWSTSQPSLGWP